MLLRSNGTPHRDGDSPNAIVLLALSVTLPPCSTDGGAAAKLIFLAAVAEAIVALLSSQRVLISVILGMALGVACVLVLQHPKEVASFLRLLTRNW